MKLTKQTITVNSPIRSEVTVAYTNPTLPGLALHRGCFRNDVCWMVTHIKSGKILMDVDDKQQGIRVLEFLIDCDVDWTLTADQLQSQRSSIRRIIVAAKNVALCGRPVQKEFAL